MKSKLILIIGIFLVIACTDKKKSNDKKVEEAIQKIDSIDNGVHEDIEDMDKSIKDVEKDLEELDNI